MSLFDKLQHLFSSENQTKTKQEEILPKEEPSGFTWDELNIRERLAFEAEMFTDIPEAQQIRLVGNPTIKLVDFLEKSAISIPRHAVESCAVIVDNWEGKTFHTVEHYENYNLLEDLVRTNENGQIELTGMNSNGLIQLIYTTTKGSGCLYLHIRLSGQMGDDAFLLARVSILHQVPGEIPAEGRKVLFTFDTKDPKPAMDMFMTTRMAAVEKINKQEDLTNVEISALGEINTIEGYIHFAGEKMKEERWGDAIADLRNAFQIIRTQALRQEIAPERFGLFYEICERLGICYMGKGLYEEARHFLILASHDSEKRQEQERIEECNRQLNNVKYCENPAIPMPATSRLGAIFHHFFDMIPSELSDLLWLDNKNHTSGSVKKQIDIWNFDFIHAMQNTDNMTLHISYRNTKAVLDEEFLDPNKDYTMKSHEEGISVNPDFLKQTTNACKDKSILRVDNSIALHIQRTNHLFTVSVMVPRFLWCDNNLNGVPQTLTLQFSDEQPVTEAAFEEFRKKALLKVQNHEGLKEQEVLLLGKLKPAHYALINASIFFEKHLWGEAFFRLKQAYDYFVEHWNSEEIDAYDKQTFGETCYKIGYILSEFQQYELAEYYLEYIYDWGVIPWNIEFVNNLTNSKDIRALSYTQHEYNDLIEGKRYKEWDQGWKKSYASFLRRRIGHILIDHHRLDEAEGLFKQLLADPPSKNHAENELKYIAELRKQEQK